MVTIPQDIIDAAQGAEEKWKVPASSQIAQWALESGWGAHSPGNNPFGMKPRSGKNDPQQMLMTKEYIKGVVHDLPQPFRKFDSIAAAFEAHAELIATAPVYAPAMAKLPDLEGFIDVMAPHYATAPLYAQTLKALIKGHDLSAFDSKQLDVA